MSDSLDMQQEKNEKHVVPDVDWVPCGMRLPEAGKFVWVVLGRTIISGEARRYDRQVAMGVLQADGEHQFSIFPYSLPLVSTEVWAWASMIPPAAPICKRADQSYDHNEEEESDE
jgi:hypothetical protein